MTESISYYTSSIFFEESQTMMLHNLFKDEFSRVIMQLQFEFILNHTLGENNGDTN